MPSIDFVKDIQKNDRKTFFKDFENSQKYHKGEFENSQELYEKDFKNV